MNRAVFLCVSSLMLMGVMTSAGFGAEQGPEPAPREDKLVLVLSGGGARGAAHVGVLKALEEMHIAPDLIVGTSMGSIVGGLYAAGWSPDEMDELLATMDWNLVFSDEVPRRDKTYRRKQDDRPILIQARIHFKKWKPYIPAGILGGQRLELLMDALEAESTTAATLDELNIPFRAVASDISTGQPVVLVDTNLATAMRASMSIPGASSPVELDGRRLVDGGAVANLPVGIAKDLGATSVIAVDISTPLDPDQDKLGDFFSILNQTNSLMTIANRDRDVRLLGDSDVLIQPDLGDISFVDFNRSVEAAERGAESTMAMKDELSRFSVDDEQWQAFLTRQRRRHRGPITVDHVHIKNTAPINDAIVRRALSIDPPAEYVPRTLLDDLMRLHSLRYFGVIDFKLRNPEGAHELVVTTPPRTDGRGSVQFGVGFSDDFNGNTGYTISARHQLLPVNRRGGEWQNVLQLGTIGLFDSRFYQPLDSAMRWFVEPSVGFQRDLVNLWSDGTPVVEYEIEGAMARLAAGRVLGRWGELRATAFTGNARAIPRIGSPIFPPDEERRGGFNLEFTVDTVDQIAFPQSGVEAHVRYERSSKGLGAETRTDLAAASIGYSISFGRNTFTPYLEVGENFENTRDYLNLFKLGGLGRLSGLGDNELLGEKMALARLLYFRRLTGFQAAGFSVRIYAGASLEAGNVYAREEPITTSSLRTAWSLFVGGDTPLGPLFLGYGRSEDRDRFYLMIGDRF
ncbi:MAG: patatin-like phospholipase family protein [Candidatus Sulfomarinibacteraceae bacterium]